MSIVTLVSGGLDSSLTAILAKEEGLRQYPLFVDYGQRSRGHEWDACRRVARAFGLPQPSIMSIPGFGKLISSGLTDVRKDIYQDAFLPGRNFMFLLCGASFAVQKDAESVVIGLLNERTHLFPDQTSVFLEAAQRALTVAMGRLVKITAPLLAFEKADVLRLASERGLTGTYSCHKGTRRPCRVCISCREYLAAIGK
jgi:7-cyano-7-deazaguanine synthase